MENKESKLFESYQMGSILLKNRIVMAPMTRSRSTAAHVPTSIMAKYYGDRAEAGLIITEGTAPSANGAGYPRIPGMYSQAMVEGWREVTTAVHAKGGVIFLQLMHTGRVSHTLNMDAGSRVVAPSALLAAGQMYTDQEGLKDHTVPVALSLEEIPGVIAEYVTAAQHAMAAGFDGVEVHAANGYLIEQFLRPSSNQRTDTYGGTIENFSRFALEVVAGIGAAIGNDKVGIRLSPFGVFGGMSYTSIDDQIYQYLVTELNKMGLAYVHLLDHSSMGAPAPEPELMTKLRQLYTGTIIQAGGLDASTAADALESGKAELVAFGRPFISNPDLVNRFRNNYPLAQADFNTFYTPGEQGFNDYNEYSEAEAGIQKVQAL
jgi:N-ethylmaleimide reductase